MNTQQYAFLLAEFGLSRDDVAIMGIDEWQKIRAESFMIEAEEAPEDDSDISERGETAASIADTKFADRL